MSATPRTAPSAQGPKLWANVLVKDGQPVRLPPVGSRTDSGRPPQTAPTLQRAGGWDATIADLKQQVLTTKATREQQQAKLISGYVGTMHNQVDNVAVQQEIILALCQIVGTGQLPAIRALAQCGGLDAIVLAMRVHLSAPDIQQRASTALAQVASVDNKCRHLVIEIGGIQSLVAAMTMHQDLAILCIRCCTALATLAVGDDESKNACIQHGVIQVTVSVMREHLRVAVIQSTGCALISAIAAGNLVHKLAAVAQGACLAIARAMDGHIEHVDVQMQGCTATERLSQGDAHCIASLVSSRCIAKTQRAVRRRPCDVRFAHLAVSTFANATKADDRTIAEMATSRFFLVLKTVLKHHLDRYQVAERGLAVLCNLLTSGKQVAGRLLQSGALHIVRGAAIANAMNKHALDQACRCVLNASTGDTESKAFIINSHCHRDVLLASMRSHSDDANLAELSISALANLVAGSEADEDEDEESSQAPAPVPDAQSRPITSHSRSRLGTSQDARLNGAADQHARDMAFIRQAIVEESAVSIVLGAMVVHTYCQPVVEEAVAFIRNLAAGNHKCRSAIVEANGLRHLIKAIKQHGTSEAIAELGCLALRNIASGTTEHLAGVMAAGGIECIVSSLRRHTCSSTVVYAGLAALRNLAVDAWENDRNPQPVRSLSAIIDADGISAIVEVMGAHINNANVQLQGCAALRNIACGTPGDGKARMFALESISSGKGIEAISTAMNAHTHVASVQAQGCAAFRNIACGHELDRQPLMSNGLLAVVMGAMRLHRTHAETQLQASACLANLILAPERPLEPSALQEEAWLKACEMAHRLATAAVDGGALTLQATTLHTHFRNRAVVVQVCSSLSALLAAPPAKLDQQALVTQFCALDGALQALIDVVPFHENDEGVFGQAIACLGQIALCLSSDEMKLICRASELKRVVMKRRSMGKLPSMVRDSQLYALL